MKINRIHNFVTLFVASDYWIVSKGYKLYKYYPAKNTKQYFAKVNGRIIGLLSLFSLTRRLFRAEIRALYHFKNNVWMCIGRKAIFKLNPKTHTFEKCCTIEKGTRPLNLCQSSNGIIYYGEYCFNPNKNEMRIFQTKDNGDTWNVVFTFKNGEVNHIHGIFQDPFTNKLWVATGDDDDACVFGYTEDNFKTFVRAYEKSQQYRICVPLFTKDKIIFATDSQYEQNYIRVIDRNSGECSNIQAIQGSGIYAVQVGEHMMISTTVEPSDVNVDQSAHLWYSVGGDKWEEIASYKKDVLPKTYFQFGSITFPQYETTPEYLLWNGRAIKKIDGKTVSVKL